MLTEQNKYQSACDLHRNSVSRVATQIAEAWSVVSLGQLVFRSESDKHLIILTLNIILLLISKFIAQHRVPSSIGYPPLKVVQHVPIQKIIFDLS